MPTIPYIENFSDWVDSFSYHHSITVRFSETDAFGHLNNTNVFVYFEEARIEFLKTLGLMERWMRQESESILVTGDLQCDYLKQVFFDEKLDIYVKVATIGRTSADIHYMAKNEEGDVCFTGRGRIVQVSKQTNRSIAWDDAVKVALTGESIASK
ncbi:acyl-CoA thioesterase [Desertibacillus haloalkaliphilus]|uniref:acyl-CoA thioesterase n=1 Tax=Desertibacillus haloalkaliphilus TaxID=1328930 RepID=UPI001C266E79|nr:thioesterase family protein [Desertibacillus haloalkaliphilus]MBU8905098.1 acyl-CoA thioesterase [Desertibacillus haloalkaliphilus]